MINQTYKKPICWAFVVYNIQSKVAIVTQKDYLFLKARAFYLTNENRHTISLTINYISA